MKLITTLASVLFSALVGAEEGKPRRDPKPTRMYWKSRLSCTRTPRICYSAKSENARIWSREKSHMQHPLNTRMV